MKHYEIMYSDGHDACHYFGTEAEGLREAIESLYESCGGGVKVLHVTEEWEASEPVLEDADFYDDIDEEFDDPAPAMVESNHGGTTMAKRQYPKADADKLKYLAQYDKENRFTASCKLSRIYDAELIEVWSTLPNKAEWLKQHLREELEKQKAGK